MKAFSGLYRQLDETTRTTEKVAAMRDYFRSVPAADAAWAVYFLSGRRPRRLLKARDMAGWCAEIAELPDWMFEECYEFVGDLAETMALLLPDADMESAEPLHAWVEQELLPLRGREPEEQRERVQRAWRPHGSPRAVCLEQADHRRVSCRCFAATRHACTGRGV